MIGYAQENGAKGLAYIIYDENGEGKGPIAKFLDESKHALLKEKAGLKAGDAVFFSSGAAGEAATIAGLVRTQVGEQLDLIEKNIFKFCWIVDFPFYEWNEDEKKIYVIFYFGQFLPTVGNHYTLYDAKVVGPKSFRGLNQYHIEDENRGQIQFNDTTTP